MAIINTSGDKEQDLKNKIRDLEAEMLNMQLQFNKREHQLISEKNEILRRNEEEKNSLLD